MKTVTEHKLIDACKALNGLTIETCYKCDGTGKRRGNTKDACDNCAGVGEVVSGHFHPDELRAIRSAVAELES